MLIKEAQFERSELIVEMAEVHEVFVEMKVCLASSSQLDQSSSKRTSYACQRIIYTLSCHRVRKPMTLHLSWNLVRL